MINWLDVVWLVSLVVFGCYFLKVMFDFQERMRK